MSTSTKASRAEHVGMGKLEGVVVAERREVQAVGGRLVAVERGADVADGRARQAADDVARLAGSGPSAGLPGTGAGVRDGTVAVDRWPWPFAPLRVGSGIWSQSSTKSRQSWLSRVRPLRRRASRSRWVGVVGCSMMRMSESGLETATTVALPLGAEVAVEQLEMVGHRVGIGGVGPGDDAAGVALEDHALAFALEMHGFEGVPSKVDAND